MPFYEYECKDCGGSFELMQSIKADPVENCELCPGTNVRRKIFPAGMIFKGSGFYSTEYRSSSYVQQQNDDKPASSSTEGSSANSKEESKGSVESTATSTAPAESGGSKQEPNS